MLSIYVFLCIFCPSFPLIDEGKVNEAEDNALWRDNWDDDESKDDFIDQLKQQIADNSK